MSEKTTNEKVNSENVGSPAALAKEYFAGLGAACVRGWDRFWFTPQDPATLGLIRIFAGLMILYTHLVWSVDLLGFFGPGGRISPEFARAYIDSSFDWSYLYWFTSPAALWCVHIAGLVAIAMFTVGLFSRTTSVLTFLAVVAYTHRAPGALFGLDQINGLLALYLMVGPCGACYSLDAWLKRRKSRAGQGGAVESHMPQSVTANIAIRLIQLHMCVIYLFAGLGKLLGNTWWDGTALWNALANYEYQTLDMTWLAAYPLVINLMTHVTLAWECSYAAIVWPRWTRPLVLALAVPLHLGIAFCMGMITFGLVMLIGNLAFVSPVVVRSLVDRPLEKLRPKSAG